MVKNAVKPESKKARRERRCTGLLILTSSWEEEC
jgi:hypothetical protein